MTRPRVAVTRPMPFPALDRLRDRCHVVERSESAPLDASGLASFATGADALLATLADPVDAALLDRLAPPLRVVANCAVGTDNVDLAAAARLGVAVANTPGVLTDATADVAMTLILMLFRRALDGDRMVRAGEFRGWEPTLLLGRDLAGATLGVFGFGRIGRAVASRAEAFGMKVIFTSRSAAVAGPATKVSFDRLVTESDVISLHAPLTPETRRIFSRDTLLRMKRGAFLVNTARGPLVDERALAGLLRSGHLAGAGFDVYDGEPKIDPELLASPNTVLLPHVGSGTVETRSRMAELCVGAILDVLDGRRPANVVSSVSPKEAG